MDGGTGQSEKRFHIVGWILFIFSAVFFTISALKNGDMPGLAGALFFLVACFVFLYPLMRA